MASTRQTSRSRHGREAVDLVRELPQGGVDVAAHHEGRVALRRAQVVHRLGHPEVEAEAEDPLRDARRQPAEEELHAARRRAADGHRGEEVADEERPVASVLST